MNMYDDFLDGAKLNGRKAEKKAKPTNEDKYSKDFRNHKEIKAMFREVDEECGDREEMLMKCAMAIYLKTFLTKLQSLVEENGGIITSDDLFKLLKQSQDEFGLKI